MQHTDLPLQVFDRGSLANTIQGLIIHGFDAETNVLTVLVFQNANNFLIEVVNSGGAIESEIQFTAFRASHQSEEHFLILQKVFVDEIKTVNAPPVNNHFNLIKNSLTRP